MPTINPSHITHIAFDADDTLWANEDVFVNAKETCEKILANYLTPDQNLDDLLYAFERKNLALFGYGIKGFMLSMMETAIELSEGKITGKEMQQFIDVGKEMLQHPVELLPYVREAIDLLEDLYPLMVITKGDLFDQENKLARSGIGHHFQRVEIVSEKTAEVYQEICDRHGIDPAGLLMLGNSLKSDVLPVVAIGGQAIHVPYHYTWQHEHLEDTTAKYATAPSLEAAIALIIP